MRYVEIGSVVVFKRENAQVVDKKEIGGRLFAVLALADGQRYDVPWLDIRRNGSGFFVTPDGHGVAYAIEEAEKVLQEIRRQLSVWDAENPNPPGYWREEAIDQYFLSWLRHGGLTHDNEALGQIVRHVVERLEDL